MVSYMKATTPIMTPSLNIKEMATKPVNNALSYRPHCGML